MVPETGKAQLRPKPPLDEISAKPKPGLFTVKTV